ncbi:MAG TPA: 3-hydroxyacyl-CoA dehydrogenase NAD-binding domain-containing protein, partial [Candidatus Dormibacteraeota bacterium]|nr:3-hydroxyacyl-CoA dehydrogenase NAD-binding domain-containing protein [Candidatus Dormibacteraeota bacterium]
MAEDDEPVAAGRLLVLGAGTMGTQIALQAALHDVDVELVDTDPEVLLRAATEQRALLARRVERGRLEAGAAEPALRRIHLTDDLAGASRASDWAIEAVPERLDL